MDDFLKSLIKEAGGELAAKINEEEKYVDTGSFILNALVSGSIFGGISQKRITGLAAPESCGKTFVALSTVKNFLIANPDGYCLYFDTEFAVNKSMLKEKGIDDSRVVIIQVVTIEDFRAKALKAVELYLKTEESKRKPCFFVLDSLGMLSTNKEITDTLAEKDTRDMTKAQLTKGAFRMLTLKLGQAGIPMIVNNHLYDSMSMYSPKEMAAGCLVAGTEIQTKNGNVPIELVQVDDLVLTKEGEWRKVLQTHKFTNKEILEIEFEDGTKVSCTPEHKFYVNGEWVEARNLSVNESVEVFESESLKILYITQKENSEVFDISVDEYENYILANGVITHNSGLKYSASTILYASKSKEKQGTEVVGVILKFKVVKSRLSRENREVEVRLFYDERGLDRYYGLLPLAVEGGIIERNGNRYIFGANKFYEKEIMKNPERFFTPEILEQIDKYANKKFKYGSSGASDLFEEDEDNEHDADEMNDGND